MLEWDGMNARDERVEGIWGYPGGGGRGSWVYVMKEKRADG